MAAGGLLIGVGERRVVEIPAYHRLYRRSVYILENEVHLLRTLPYRPAHAASRLLEVAVLAENGVRYAGRRNVVTLEVAVIYPECTAVDAIVRPDGEIGARIEVHISLAHRLVAAENHIAETALASGICPAGRVPATHFAGHDFVDAVTVVGQVELLEADYVRIAFPEETENRIHAGPAVRGLPAGTEAADVVGEYLQGIALGDRTVPELNEAPQYQERGDEGQQRYERSLGPAKQGPEEQEGIQQGERPEEYLKGHEQPGLCGIDINRKAGEQQQRSGAGHKQPRRDTYESVTAQS